MKKVIVDSISKLDPEEVTGSKGDISITIAMFWIVVLGLGILWFSV